MTLVGHYSFGQTITASPNPFIQTATISFSTPTADSVSLVVLNLWGQTVRNIVHDTILPASSYSFVFDGDSLLPGPYIVMLRYGALTKGVRVLKVSNPNGLSDIENNSQDFIYPNPAKNVIYFSAAVKNGDVIISDASGKRIDITNEDNHVDISALPKGIYWISFDSSVASRNYPFVKE